MEPTTTAPNMTPNMANPTVTPHGTKKVGPIVATLIIVLILIIAALYLFASRINNQQPNPTDAATAGDTTEPAPATSVQPVTGTSNDTASLQSDLNASTNGIDNQSF